MRPERRREGTDMKTTFPAALAALSIAATPGAARDSHDLDPIIVSGGLTPIEAARYGRAATVITAQEIEERGILSVQDALRAVPGLSVNSAGGNVTQVRIRGGEGNHTLILIDGVEAAGGDSEYVLSGLETANIERIEVLRGPQSVTYGSNASSGVVNIITRKGTEGTQYGGSVEYGGGWAGAARFSVRDARGGLSFGYAKREDDGWDFSGSGGEKDGTDRWTVTLAGDYQVSDAVRLGFTYRKAGEHYDYDGNNYGATTPAGYVVDSTTEFSDRDEETWQVFADLSAPGGRVAGRRSFERTSQSQGYNGGAPTFTESDALKARVSYGIDGAADSANHVLSLLAERERDSSSSNPTYNRQNDSVALEYRGSLENGVDIQLGARHDRNSVFGDSTTWTAALSYTMASGVRFHASAGTGVVNPSYFELYANAFGYTGNPNLKPEKNQSFDLGVEVPFAGDRGVIDVTLFRETLLDEIVSVETAPFTYTYANAAGKSHRKGIEVSGRFQATEDLSFRLSYTRLDAREAVGIEVRRPKHELGLGATLLAFDGRGTLTADARYVAGNFDTFNGVRSRLPDFWKVDLAATYAVTDTLRLTARVENLFDTSYFEAWGYYNRGRTIYVGLNSEF